VSTDATDMFDELDGLDALRDAFPAYLFWQEELPGHVRYVARSRYLEASPHTVVAAEVDELEQALRMARQNAPARLAIVPAGQPAVSPPPASSALMTTFHGSADDCGGTMEVPRSLITAARELMARTMDLPSSKRGLEAFLDDYRQMMFQIAVQNYQP
jgi:hypothetical protein